MARRRSAARRLPTAAPRFPVAVIGPGSLGLFYASRLARVVRTAVVARTEARAAQLRSGVRVGNRLYKPETFGPGKLPRADTVIILVKAHQTHAAARVAARMQAKTIVSLQNGLIDAVPQGVTTAAAWRKAGGAVVPVTTGKTLLPAGHGALARILSRAGFPTSTVRNIQPARLHKLLANVCLNPVTALFRQRNAEVLRPPCLQFVEALAREAAAVLEAEGLRLTPALAVEKVIAVARATAKNRSSMLQDVLAGRRTEIGELTGALLRLARENHVAVPTHRAFHRLIRVIDRGLESAASRRQLGTRRLR